jgi:hypothetical protein
MNSSQLIDKAIARHPDWRGRTMAEVRRIIREALPDVTEDLKWMGTPTWSRDGIVCICNAFKDMVKVTFIDGAKLDDADGVFNAELGGNRWRAIKLFQGDAVNEAGLKKLLLAAAALNAAKPAKGKGKAKAAVEVDGASKAVAAKEKPAKEKPAKEKPAKEKPAKEKPAKEKPAKAAGPAPKAKR